MEDCHFIGISGDFMQPNFLSHFYSLLLSFIKVNYQWHISLILK